jgi:hypothetical protein
MIRNRKIIERWIKKKVFIGTISKPQHEPNVLNNSFVDLFAWCDLLPSRLTSLATSTVCKHYMAHVKIQEITFSSTPFNFCFDPESSWIYYPAQQTLLLNLEQALVSRNSLSSKALRRFVQKHAVKTRIRRNTFRIKNWCGVVSDQILLSMYRIEKYKYGVKCLHQKRPP